MKRLSFFFLLLFCCCCGNRATYAQFNQRYDSASVVWDLVSCNNGDFVTVSSDGFRRYDVNGSLLWQYYYPTPDLLPGGVHPCKLVHTDDDGILYVGINSMPYINPFVLKLNVAGALVWAKTYWSTHHSAFGVVDAFNVKVDVKRMNSGREDYIITSTTTPAKGAVYPQTDGSRVQVMRIEGSGRLVWNKQYQESVPAPWVIVRDNGNAVSYAGRDPLHGDLYYVAGTRIEYHTTGIANFMLQMLIDENGNLVRPFQKLTTCGYPGMINAIYDSQEDKIVTSFIMGDCGVQGPTYSEMAVMQNDRTLAPVSFNYYWLEGTNENYVYRIAKSPLNGDYLLSGWAYHRSMFYPLNDSDEVTNMTLLRLRVDGMPRFYKHYMVEENAKGPTYMDIGLDGSQQEHIVLASRSLGRHSGNTYARLLSTDMAGTVCGSREFPIRQDRMTPIAAPESYIPDSMYSESDLRLFASPVYTTAEDCKFDNDYNFRPAPLAINDPLAAPAVKVYPTLLSGTNTTVYFELPAVKGTVEVAIFSMDGRLVKTVYYKGRPASGTEQMDVSVLQKGSYLVRIRSNDKSMNASARITRL